AALPIFLSGAPGHAPAGAPVVPPGGGFLDACAALPASGLPAWLTSHDIDTFAAEYAGRGFTGPLNWYRNLDRNWELTAAWHHGPFTVPARFLGGDRGLVIGGTEAAQMRPRQRAVAPRLRDPVL